MEARPWLLYTAATFRKVLIWGSSFKESLSFFAVRMSQLLSCHPWPIPGRSADCSRETLRISFKKVQASISSPLQGSARLPLCIVISWARRTSWMIHSLSQYVRENNAKIGTRCSTSFTDGNFRLWYVCPFTKPRLSRKFDMQRSSSESLSSAGMPSHAWTILALV